VEYVAEHTFSGVITPGASEALIEGVTVKAADGAARIVLDISSPGGDVEAAVQTYLRLSSLPVELVTHSSGEVSSMATVLYLAGQWRTANSSAEFLFHPTRLLLRTGDILTAADLREMRLNAERSRRTSEMLWLDAHISELARDDRRIRSIVVERTGMTEGEALTLMESAKPISATEATGLGIVHEIVSGA
jgi:ATP-dependent protease ClpP protease subunit